MRGLPWIALAALAGALPMLQGCASTATGTGALIAEDRRSSGTYVDDQGIELKAGNRVSEKYRDLHVNVTSFNRVALLTGEAPNAEAKADVGKIVLGVAGRAPGAERDRHRAGEFGDGPVQRHVHHLEGEDPGSSSRASSR